MTELPQDTSLLLVDAAIVVVLTLGVLSLLWLAATNLRDIGRAFAWLWTAVRRGRLSDDEIEDRRPRETQPSAPAPEPRLSHETQWSRVTGRVAAGIGRTRAAEKLHGAAEDQLDAALYGLQRLSAELTGLLPAAETPRREAEVHWLRDRFTGRAKPDRAEAA